jgi:hypothetical protein
LNSTNYSYAAAQNPTTLRDTTNITFGRISAIVDQSQLINPFSLTIAPNPLSNSAKLSFYLPKAGQTTLRIYNLKGIPIQTMIDDILAPGNHQYTLFSSELNNGTYLIGLINNGQQVTQKIVVQK